MSSVRAPSTRPTAVAALATLLLTTLIGMPAFGQVLPPDEGAITLGEARSGHTATLLPDDYVLLAGGFDGETELASVEVVDPVGMAVEVLGPLVAARSGHTATPLSDGRILLAGGHAGDTALATAELYDPTSGLSEPTGSMQAARADHDAVPLPDGRVLIVGGVDGDEPVATAELFDPATDTFDAAASPMAIHVGGTAISLPDGRVLLSGELAAAEPAKDTQKGKKTKKSKNKKKKTRKTAPAPMPAEILDPDTGKWSPVKGGGKLQGHVAVHLPYGGVLLAGGSGAEAEIFSSTSDTFMVVHPMAEPRAGFTATSLPDDRVLIAGGANAGFELPMLEVFDPIAGGFEPAGEMLIPRVGHTATALSDGRVLIAGGSFADIALDDLLVYDSADVSLQSLDLDSEVGLDPVEVTDSRTRADVRAQYGAPDAFTLYFYDEVKPDGSIAPVRLEQWSYHHQGVELTIADDQVVGEDPLEVEEGTVVEPAPYDPDAFDAYVDLEEVVAAAGLEEYLGGPADEIVENGELYFAEQLTWGMKDGELRYLEALALAAEDPVAETD